jgi:hypothetical protein
MSTIYMIEVAQFSGGGENSGQALATFRASEFVSASITSSSPPTMTITLTTGNITATGFTDMTSAVESLAQVFTDMTAYYNQ